MLELNMLPEKSMCAGVCVCVESHWLDPIEKEAFQFYSMC